MSDSTRRQVLGPLGDNSASGSRLSGPLGTSRQTVAKHLRILVDAGLAGRTRKGREIVREPAAGGLVPAMDFFNGPGARPGP